MIGGLLPPNEQPCTEKTHEVLSKYTNYKYCVHCGVQLLVDTTDRTPAGKKKKS